MEQHERAYTRRSDTGAALLHTTGSIGIGIHDGFSARLATGPNVGFLWLSSFGMSAARGVPDVGLLDAEDVARAAQVARRSSPLPLAVDLDAGYGDPVKVRHAVESMARSGANAVSIEDNPIAKRCSLYDGVARELVTAEEHAARVRAAAVGVADAGTDCQIIARTEALVAGLGVEEALRRCDIYVQAGANAVFAQCVGSTPEALLQFCSEWNRRTPVFLAPTNFPDVSPAEWFAAGASHVIYANQLLRAAHRAMSDVVCALGIADPMPLECLGVSSVAAIAETVGRRSVDAFEADIARTLPQPILPRPRT